MIKHIKAKTELRLDDQSLTVLEYALIVTLAGVAVLGSVSLLSGRIGG